MTKTHQAVSLDAPASGHQPARKPSRPRTCFALPLIVPALAILGLQLQAQTATETILHTFASPPRGSNPSAGVISDAAGNLYGVTSTGGLVGAGIVFKIDPSGRETVLYSFTGGADGAQPTGGLIRDSHGNLYGTTSAGGASGRGTVYKLDAAGHETVLHSFTGYPTDGASPYDGLARDPAGNIYGTALSGGEHDNGVVFDIDPTGRETLLHSFDWSDGAGPYGGVVRDSAGELFGTTIDGGSTGAGVVYKIDGAGHQKVLYNFTGGADGGSPETRVNLDATGNIYGTASSGGTGFGVVYKINPAGQETVLHTFTGGTDGGYPASALALDSIGNLYGTASYGGDGARPYGIVYSINAAGVETVLYNFEGASDGSYPSGDLVRDALGNLYGTANSGGSAQLGTVFKLDSAGQQTVLYSFPSPADGRVPVTGVIRDSAGNLFGATRDGGANGWGMVYRIAPNGEETVLYTFKGGTDGASPSSAVIQDYTGNLYGTTYWGGAGAGFAGAGVVYKVDTSGNETVLYAFTGGADGALPWGGVIMDAAGNLYGTTSEGGAAGHGVVYKLDASGHETVLYSFTGGADGGSPLAGVSLDAAGNLYGTTELGGNLNCSEFTAGCGVVFKLDASGQESVLHTFSGGGDGSLPYAGVILDSAGNLYGTTSQSIAGGQGDVYKLDTGGHLTVLHSFCSLANCADGAQPTSGLVLDPAGNLYGTTISGGTGGYGVVFELSASGEFTPLYSFTNGLDGGFPSGVVRGPSGDLYGTAQMGGKRTSGVVFRVKP